MSLGSPMRYDGTWKMEERPPADAGKPQFKLKSKRTLPNCKSRKTKTFRRLLLKFHRVAPRSADGVWGPDPPKKDME